MAMRVVRAVMTRGNSDDTLPREAEILAAAGAEMVTVPYGDRARLMELVRDADGLYGSVVVDLDLIEQMPNVRGVITVSHGYNNIDLEAATDAGLPVANVYFCHREVANHTIMLLLAATRKLIPMHNALRNGVWDRDQQPPVPPLYGETMGLIGFGHIGREVARRALAMDLRVIAYDPVVSAETARQHGAELVELDDLVRTADYISPHLPSSPKTRHILDARRIGMMKPTAWVINTARGDLIEEAALYAALRDRRIAGAGLDVFEVEPTPSDNPILKLDNVVVTPHAAGYSDAALHNGQLLAAEQMARVLTGSLPENLINTDVRGRTRFPLG